MIDEQKLLELLGALERDACLQRKFIGQGMAHVIKVVRKRIDSGELKATHQDNPVEPCPVCGRPATIHGRTTKHMEYVPEILDEAKLDGVVQKFTDSANELMQTVTKRELILLDEIKRISGL